MAAADQAAKVAIQAAKGGALIVGGWLLKKFGDKAADEGFEKGKEAASKRSGDRRQRTLAQDMARAHGWKYTERHVIADEHRYVSPVVGSSPCLQRWLSPGPWVPRRPRRAPSSAESDTSRPGSMTAGSPPSTSSGRSTCLGAPMATRPDVWWRRPLPRLSRTA